MVRSVTSNGRKVMWRCLNVVCLSIYINMISAVNILFNELKHHRASILRLAQQATEASVAGSVKVLGNSQMDVYYGLLDVPVLFEEVVAQLPVNSERDYLHWLAEGEGYRKIILSDASQWILLRGIEPGQYVHLHPARYSPHSMRMKATTLKTAIACLVCLPGVAAPSLEQLNAIRNTLLDLSPVKDIAQCHHLWKVIDLLRKEVGC
ncbi:hypothetical protein FLA_3326 [Filimonas lacunae]|nr:hypothetical protein FLA_3326 [Filimonas lacunae]